MRRPFKWLLVVGLLLIALLRSGVQASLHAQDSPISNGTVTTTPGARYAATGLKALLLGSDYRSLWTASVEVPVLDLDKFAGGLTPSEQGGGQQTLSLRFMGADGREYAFRSVDKWPGLAEHPDVKGALLADLVQDQVSSMVPAAPLAAARMSVEVGLMHAQPTLYVMPDSPLLGEYRATFAGMLGTLEERADEVEGGGPGFHGYVEITGTESLLDLVEESSENRLDSRTYLYARLLDLVMGDWDRHEDQWRWAREDLGDFFLWIPIPRDRDYAFADYDGLVMRLVRQAVPNAVQFTEQFRDLDGLLLNGRTLDRQVLADLPRPVWDEVALELQSALTDEVIEASLDRLPREFVELEGAELSALLRSRRDQLPQLVEDFYSRIARVPTIYTTDEDEMAVVTRHSDGSVTVRVFTAERTGSRGEGRLYFERTFVAPETREIRLFLRGGDDRATVEGTAARGVRVRVMGGGGDDILVDSSRVAQRGRWTSLHDDDRDDVLAGGASTWIDRRPFEEANQAPDGLMRVPGRDWGVEFHHRPLLDYSTTRGFVVGFGTGFTRFGFRRVPYAARVGVDLRYATRWSDFGLRGRGTFHGSDPALVFDAEVTASRIDAMRFYGFGNATPDDQPSSTYVVRREFLEGRLDVGYALGALTTARLGMIGQYSDPWVIPGSPLSLTMPTGTSRFRALGFHGGVGLATSEWADTTMRWRLGLDTSVFPISSNAGKAYGALDAGGTLRLPLTGTGSTALSARAGARYVWGDYPFFAAAFLGGRQSLRGFPEWRYAGDGMVYGGIEAIAPIGRLPLFLNWRMAGFVFADAGRIFLAGEDSNHWHAAPGVGISLSALSYNLRLSYAHGTHGRVYLETSNPF